MGDRSQLVFFLESGHGVRKRPLINQREDGTKYEIGGPLYFEFQEEEASP